MKRRNAQSIGEVIAGFMQQEYSSQAALEMRASALWPEVVGPGVNRYTTNRWVRDGVLHVHISSAALKNELMMTRHSLIARLNERVGSDAIKEIQFH